MYRQKVENQIKAPVPSWYHNMCASQVPEVKGNVQMKTTFFAADWLWNSSCCPPVAVVRLRLAGALELSGPRWRLEALPHSEWAADWVQAEDEAPRSSLWRQTINGTAPALNCNNCTCESTQTDDNRTHTLKGELRQGWLKLMRVISGGWLGAWEAILTSENQFRHLLHSGLMASHGDLHGARHIYEH